jgi:hypothetical protein
MKNLFQVWPDILLSDHKEAETAFFNFVVLACSIRFAGTACH